MQQDAARRLCRAPLAVGNPLAALNFQRGHSSTGAVARQSGACTRLGESLFGPSVRCGRTGGAHILERVFGVPLHLVPTALQQANSAIAQARTKRRLEQLADNRIRIGLLLFRRRRRRSGGRVGSCLVVGVSSRHGCHYCCGDYNSGKKRAHSTSCRWGSAMTLS